MEKKKIDKKAIIYITITIFVFILGIIVGYVIKPTNKICETKDEEKVKVIENKAKIGDIEFSLENTEFKEEGNNKISNFEIKVINKSKESKYIGRIKAKIKDIEGKELGILIGVINEEIASEEERIIICGTSEDLRNYKEIEYEIEEGE